MKPTREAAFQLDAGCIEVWPVRLRASQATLDVFHAFLDSREKARKARFHFQHLKDSYTVSQGVLRFLLARYAATSPAEIRFRHGPRGKPSLAWDDELQFNASHSGGLGLFAFAQGQELGVDVEKIRPLSDSEDIARRYFCQQEWRQLLDLEDAQQESAFYLCWTRKEAYLKAVGDGLATPLDSFQVTLRPGEESRMVHLDNDAEEARRWRLHNLSPAAGFAGALAYRGEARKIRLHPPLEPAFLLEWAGR